MARIVDWQNEAAQIKLLRARRQTYRRANWLLGLQLVLTLMLPVAGSVVAGFYPEVMPWNAAGALVVILLNVWLLDRGLARLIRRAALIGEEFDCRVLDLPWDSFTVGDRLDAEEIHSAARAHGAKHDEKLANWYPGEVAHVPFHLGRIICQRTNLHYDSRLRRTYCGLILLAFGITFGGFFAWGLAERATLEGWVLTMAPATPFLTWLAHEFYRQADTANLLESRKKETRAFWEEALEKRLAADECQVRSRQLQNVIFQRRAGSPLPLPFLYGWMRKLLEEEMHEGAAHFVAQYSATLDRHD